MLLGPKAKRRPNLGISAVPPAKRKSKPRKKAPEDVLQEAVFWWLIVPVIVLVLAGVLVDMAVRSLTGYQAATFTKGLFGVPAMLIYLAFKAEKEFGLLGLLRKKDALAGTNVQPSVAAGGHAAVSVTKSLFSKTTIVQGGSVQGAAPPPVPAARPPQPKESPVAALRMRPPAPKAPEKDLHATCRRLAEGIVALPQTTDGVEQYRRQYLLEVSAIKVELERRHMPVPFLLQRYKDVSGFQLHELAGDLGEVAEKLRLPA
ncbi:MAG: hypothetical protein QOD77_1032 [Thermoplasmata archaeon]|jgi:hypothetical protein|nr:hypothetical protein [Thermoplasmata archaeon]